jgi:hypothetical protein
MPAFVYKKNIKCYKCECTECGVDRGFQPLRNLNKKCVKCSNKSRGPKSESFKQKISAKMKGNKNSAKPEPTPEQIRSRKSRYNKKAHTRNKDRYKNDIEFRLRCVLRSRLKVAIQNNYKNGSAVKDLGCSISEFRTYMESKFQPGMTWENWSLTGWHLDHIVPLSAFDLSDREELVKACHYANLQPMWAKDNISKGGAHAGVRL